MEKSQIIPLFPLGIVALPGNPAPLHIFEERYKEMIGRCLEENLDFGIVWFNGEQINGAGCSVRIQDVLTRYEDGRMDIVALGQRRFQIQEIFEKRAYLEARVVFFDDAPEPLTDEIARLTEKGGAVYRELAGMLTADATVGDVDLSDPEHLSFMIAGFEGFGPKEKQAFLEMTSTRARLEKGVAAMEKVVERLSLTREVERIVGGNGHATEDLRQKMGQIIPTQKS